MCEACEAWGGLPENHVPPMTAPTGLAAESVEGLAVRMCNVSRHHAAGTGRHDADRWGPCSLHEQAAEDAFASAAVRLAAEARAEAWDEGLAASYVHPEPPNPYRAALAEEGGAEVPDEGDALCHEFIDTGRCGHSDSEHDAMADGHSTETAR